MKKLSIYYFIHIAINIVLIVCFRSHINVHLLSILPVFFSCLMAFQVTLFKVENQRSATGDTAYSVGNAVRLTDEEMDCQYSYLRHSFLVCIPFEIIGGIIFKVKKGKEIQDRINKEKIELEEQIRREEMGLK